MSNFEKDTSYNAEGLIDFYNRYLLKHEDQLRESSKIPKNVITRIPSTKDFLKDKQQIDKNNVLLVIDLQNDFLDIPLNKELPQPPNRIDDPQVLSNNLAGPVGGGTFAVGSSSAIINPIYEFIKDPDSGLNKIIFSRDWHSSQHCSFLTNSGPFPSHCLTNSLGAAFPKELKIEDFSKNENVEVVYKGIKNNVDSFGAFKYQTPEFLAKRQIGANCCGGNGLDCSDPNKEQECNTTCSRFTGGFKREKFDPMDFENFPFQINDISSTRQIGVEVNQSKLIGGKEVNDISLTKLIPFDLDVLSLSKDVSNNIYICGLAGDYCVQDTAINIAEKIQKDGNFKDNTSIYIVQDFTRYVMLPLFGPAGQGFSTEISGGNYKLDNEFFVEDASKAINYYAFKVNFGDKSPYVKLSKEEVNAYKDTGITGNDSLWHFTSNDIEILEKYSKLGIKILVSTQNFKFKEGKEAPIRDNPVAPTASVVPPVQGLPVPQGSPAPQGLPVSKGSSVPEELPDQGLPTQASSVTVGGRRSSRKYKKVLGRSKQSKKNNKR